MLGPPSECRLGSGESVRSCHGNGRVSVGINIEKILACPVDSNGFRAFEIADLVYKIVNRPPAVAYEVHYEVAFTSVPQAKNVKTRAEAKEIRCLVSSAGEPERSSDGIIGGFRERKGWGGCADQDDSDRLLLRVYRGECC